MTTVTFNAIAPCLCSSWPTWPLVNRIWPGDPYHMGSKTRSFFFVLFSLFLILLFIYEPNNSGHHPLPLQHPRNEQQPSTYSNDGMKSHCRFFLFHSFVLILIFIFYWFLNLYYYNESTTRSKNARYHHGDALKHTRVTNQHQLKARRQRLTVWDSETRYFFFFVFFLLTSIL